jgi:nicotinamide-nucleotide amidase
MFPSKSMSASNSLIPAGITMPNDHDAPLAAAILSVGDELTLGQTLDTNARWIARELTSLGVRVVEHVTVADDRAEQSSSIARLAARTQILVVTGGLGPTADDLTRFALTDVLRDRLIEDAPALATLEAWYAGRGRPMPEPNRVQALRPASAIMLDNPHGTAPGLLASIGPCRVVCLPGPPREMQPMFAQVVPTLIPHASTIATRVLSTFGLGESRIAELLGDLMDRSRNPLVGTTASGGLVSIRLRGMGLSPAALDHTEALVREILGPIVFARDATLAQHVTTRLLERNETLATVESCTGGLVGAAITENAGASQVFVGGLLTYSNALKIALAGVEPEVLDRDGAVSEACAVAMARGGRQRLATTHALAVTGIAGPDGGRDDKPVGTVWIALDSVDAPTLARRFRFPGDRASVRLWSVVSALGMLRLRLDNVQTPMLFEQPAAT